jgi:hypothetical protein
MSSYPHEPGHKGTSDTGVRAAKIIGRRSRTIRQSVLATLKGGPRTAEDIGLLIGEHFMVVRARCSELRGQGFIQDSGVRGQGALGGKVIVWRVSTVEELAAFCARRAAEDEKRGGQ